MANTDPNFDSDFQPRFILDNEIESFGLPSISSLPTVMTMVDAASTLIDEYCGRIDATGGGSLIYCTYAERLLIPQGRNIVRVTFPPMVYIDVSVRATLSASTTQYGEHFDTGFIPNVPLPNGNFSSILGASGRYGYGRRSQQQVYPDLNYMANVLQIASLFGGPPQFTPIDLSLVDINPGIGEIWLPAGLYLSQYTEVVIMYNTGFNPLSLPKGIKHACAALVKNFIARAGGVTSIKGYSAGKVHAQFTQDLIDPTVDRYLAPFRRAMMM
jgi:hypothetical protein